MKTKKTLLELKIERAQQRLKDQKEACDRFVGAGYVFELRAKWKEVFGVDLTSGPVAGAGKEWIKDILQDIENQKPKAVRRDVSDWMCFR